MIYGSRPAKANGKTTSPVSQQNDTAERWAELNEGNRETLRYRSKGKDETIVIENKARNVRTTNI